MNEPRPWYGSRQRSTPTSSVPQRFVRSSPALDNAAWTISSRMIAGIVLYAGLGWLISQWWGNRSVLIAIGAFVGLGLSYYLIFSGLAREDRIAAEQQAETRNAREDTK